MKDRIDTVFRIFNDLLNEYQQMHTSDFISGMIAGIQFSKKQLEYISDGKIILKE
jgi:hypothetical protein